MSTISIQPEQLRGRARELAKLRQQQLDLMKQMRILVMSLSDSWKGEAQEAFQANFLAKSKTMNELSSTLQQYIDLANTAAKKAEEADRTLLRQIKSHTN